MEDKKKKSAYVVALGLLATGCLASPSEDSGEVRKLQQALDVTKPTMLTIKQGSTLASLSNEAQRQANTQSYYQKVKIAPNGQGTATIASALTTLTAFKTQYGFASGEQVASYYNRGDLGIGREMHCVDKLSVANNGQIACYVRNFAAGDDGSEFTFGESSTIAFKNMNAHHAFATVAMVYRDLAPEPNKVIFVVYGADDSLSNAAALDRVGIQFASGKNTSSVPGVNFNNHIPSNCITCHGVSKGQAYDFANASTSGNLFLPFDLDAFEYEGTSGVRRTDQLTSAELTAFKKLNEMVWKVAVRSGSDLPSHSVRTQLDTFYNNTTLQQDNRSEVFENGFDSSAVPQGWKGSGFEGVYTSVVRPACRSCHITNSLPFDTELQFRGFASTIAGDLCNYRMPHALQTVREFWLSNRPVQLKSYWRSLNESAATAAANQLDACGPGNVATLDPHQIMTTAAAIMP